MKASANSGRGSFREFEHTADVGIEVTAADRPALFAIAGETLFALIVDPQSIAIRDIIAVPATGGSPEGLLDAWLREFLAQFNKPSLRLQIPVGFLIYFVAQ